MADATVNMNHRSLAAVINELKDELKEFLQTRYQMLMAEIGEKIRTVKTAAPMLVVAAVFLTTAYLLFTLCLVGLLSVAFQDSPYRWFLSFLIIAVVWAIIGGMAAAFGIRELRNQGLAPKKTIKVLKEDQVWLQHEARTQL